MPTAKRLNAPFIVILGIIIAMVAFAGPASAQPYVTQPTISVSTQTVRMGGQIRLCGRGFHALTRVKITLDQRIFLASLPTNSSGAFCATVRIPARVFGGPSGGHRIWASDPYRHIASAWIRIVAPTISASPRTPTMAGQLRLCGQWFRARTRVTIRLDNRIPLTYFTTNSRGAFCGTVRLPARVSGGHRLWANDGYRGIASTWIRILLPGVRVAGVSLTAGTTTNAEAISAETTSAATTSSGELAFTGAVVIGIGALGGLLLVGGGLMLLTGRRRKTVS